MPCGVPLVLLGSAHLRLPSGSPRAPGADLTFLSCFPGEAEWCYPPLTYLSPTGRRERHAIGGTLFEIVEVEPRFSS